MEREVGPPPAEMVDTRFPATPEAVARQIDAVAAIVADHSDCHGLRSDLAIVLGEVLNNIVEHSVGAGGDGCIGLTVRTRHASLLVETIDRGRPLPPRLLTHAALPEMGGGIPDLPEGGFGWFIIHSLARDMMYERDAGANRLSFRLDASV
ncbi:ATP-binding protein [Jannaschia sp. S6380]|uniref:ATP-binding protein n=1 Tax=Jannaschia sp. S6380 TaxID=2926408 RepID=UPI001FF24C4B|nr:ATP-binding protein [Jannaschia sp. S6380]MCK0168896.1 ATP-binding protein [Jannaschia sp. S6380]